MTNVLNRQATKGVLVRRELWQRRLLESVFVFYTADLEYALDHLTIERGTPPLDALAQLRPFFELPDEQSPEYENTMLEKYRVDTYAPELFKELDIPPTPYNKAISQVPKSNEEIGIYIHFAKELQKILNSMEDNEIASAYRMLEIELAKANEARDMANGRERDTFSFFNELSCDAEFEFWRRAAVWTLEECVSLSMGKEPRRVNYKTLGLPRIPVYSPFRIEFRSRLDLIRRAQTAGLLSEPADPRQFISWARSLQWELPSQLTEGLESVPPIPLSKRLEAEPKEVSLNILYRLILGMAISRFEHRTDKNSNATAAIENELQELQIQDDAGPKTLGKISVSNDKIREALKAAADHLHASWSEPIRWAGFKRPRNKSEI